MSYDLFISYSRKDNQEHRVSELVKRIQDDYQAFAGEKLSCFFDVTEIKAMDDWRDRILGGLRESKLLLLVLSPAYLASPYCEWEIVEFLKYEHSRALQGQGVAQVYFVEIPGLDTPDFEKQTADWMARVRQRNHVDLRPWHEHGAESLKEADVQTRLEDLERSLNERLSGLRRIVDAPGNLPAHNSRFVGREVEMKRLHTATGHGQYGVLTAVQGVGGMGKTALAIQYAYAYADFYPGGRWLVGCAGRSSLAAVVRSLDSDLGIQFTEEEKIDDTRATKRVLFELENRAQAGAIARAGEKVPPEPRALLLLDNVDDPALLQMPSIDLVTGRKWLHVIATTRLDPGSIGMDNTRHCHLPVDELPEDDALRLIESYQPLGRFSDEEERTAALEIVCLLRGFTLAVEVVAVHLGERKGQLACKDLLNRLRREGVDGIAGMTIGAVSHVEKLLSVTLAPTLETLNAAETRTLLAAALLPPDSVPLPWLRAIVTEIHTELATDAKPGYDDPWLALLNHLLGLRLLQVIEWTDDRRSPRLCRIHRLVQTVIKQRAVEEVHGIESSLLKTVEVRAQYLAQEEWPDWNYRWEIISLGNYAEQEIKRGVLGGVILAACAAACMRSMGDYASAEPLIRLALEFSERNFGTEHSSTLSSGGQLAFLLMEKGDYAGAEPLFRRALEINERCLGPEHLVTLMNMDNLASLLESKGDFMGAEALLRRALETSERIRGPEDGFTLSYLSVLAGLLMEKGDYAGAEPLIRQALEVRERQSGPDSRDVLNSASILASLLEKKCDYAAAEPFRRRALEVCERRLGPDNPATLVRLNSLAGLLESKDDYTGAESLYRRVLETRERLWPVHPDTQVSMNNLGFLLERKGDCKSAELLYRRALETSERVLGVEDSNTLCVMSNLASLFQRIGDYASAEPLFRRVLEIRVRRWPEHRVTLWSERNLASLLETKGDFTTAENMYRRVLKTQERIFGLEDRDTLISMNSLARLLEAKGEYIAAEDCFRKSLAACEQVLGIEDSETLVVMSNLAHLMGSAGNYNGAEPLIRRVLEVRERQLGPEHYRTLGSMNSLAIILENKGAYADAESIYRNVIEVRERVLGTEHPDTLSSESALAGFLERRGEYVGAESLYCRVLEASEKGTSPGIHNTPLYMSNLARIRSKTGDYAGAELLYRRALEVCERLYGAKHANTLTMVNNWANMLTKYGDFASAEPLYIRALDDSEEGLGLDHPDTLVTLNNLAVLLKKKGDYAGAAGLYRRALERLVVDGCESERQHQFQEACVKYYIALLEKTGLSKKEIRMRVNSVLGK